jgi:molybdenum transport protein
MFLSADEIDRMIKEDVPYFDLTSHMLGIRDQAAAISCFTREEIVCCGTEEADQIFRRLGVRTEFLRPSGEIVPAGESLISGRGAAESLHIAWKVSQNVLDHCSGVATKTRRMVEAARAVNPRVAILTTRKGFPGTKALSIKSILAGGAFPHRLGLSETILVFKQHMNFVGGLEGLIERLPEMRRGACEKKIIVETASAEEAERLCAAGADGIQFDKLPAPELRRAAEALRRAFPHVTLLAAGGVNEKNVAEYAASGVDGIVTTSLYSAAPADIGVRIAPDD